MPTKQLADPVPGHRSFYLTVGDVREDFGRRIVLPQLEMEKAFLR